MRIASRSLLVGTLLLAACSAQGTSPAPGAAADDGPMATHARTIAAESGVPGDLVLAIAALERGLELPARLEAHPDDNVPIAGILELRRGYFDSLTRGAELMEVSVQQLRENTDLGTVAGIRILAELGAQSGAHIDDVASFSDAVGTMSGYRDPLQIKDYVARVYRLLRAGGSFPARDGEVVTIAPHPEVPVSLTIAEPPRSTLATPQFPGAEWLDTSCNNKCNTSRNRTVDSILIHDTEGSWDSAAATLQNDGGKSVHYLIEWDGSRVGQFIPESYMGWHAGNSCWNNRSVGIEHVGYVRKDYVYPTSLYRKSAELVKSIRSRHDVPLDRAHIIGHYQVPGSGLNECSAACSAGLDACESNTSYGGANHHTDPGYNWQWCQYMEMLGGSCACNDAWSLFNCTQDGTQVWRCKNGSLEKQECPNGCTSEALGTEDHCTATVDPGGGGAGGTTVDAATADDGGEEEAGSGGAGGETTSPDASSGAGGAAGGGAAGGAGAAGGPTEPGGAGGTPGGGDDAGAGGEPVKRAPAQAASEDDGCSCSTGPGKGTSSWGAAAFAAALWAGRRRRAKGK